MSAQSDKMSPLLYISSSYTSLQFHWIGSRLNAWLRIDTVDCCLLKRLWTEKNLQILSLRTKIWRQMNVMGGLKEFMFPQCDRFHCENLFFLNRCFKFWRTGITVKSCDTLLHLILMENTVKSSTSFYLKVFVLNDDLKTRSGGWVV